MQRKGASAYGSTESNRERQSDGAAGGSSDRRGGDRATGVGGSGVWSTVVLLVFAGVMVLLTMAYTSERQQASVPSATVSLSAVQRAYVSSFGENKVPSSSSGDPGAVVGPDAPVQALRRVPSVPSQPDYYKQQQPQQPVSAPAPPTTPQQLRQQPQPEPATPAAPAPAPAPAPATPPRGDAPSCADATPSVKFFTYANRGSKDSKFCRGLHSAIQNRVDLTVLNWGGQHTGGNSNKYRIVQTAIKDMQPCDYVVFTDAYDVVFVQGEEHIKAQLEAMPSLEFLFGAECGCWPQLAYPNGKDLCYNKYPKSPTPYRWANTGMWAARVWAAKRFLTRILAELDGPAHANKPTDDQQLTNSLLLKGETSLFSLDYHASLFQNFHAAAADCQPHKDVHIKGGTVVNALTHTQPSILHFNGNSKNVLLSMEWGLWYSSPVPPASAAAHPPRLTPDEVDAHPIKLGPVPSLRESVSETPFRELCQAAKTYHPHPQHHNNKVRIEGP